MNRRDDWDGLKIRPTELRILEATIAAEKRQQEIFDQHIREERARADRRARMSASYQAGSPLQGVSLYSLENEVDPTRILGADGSPLIGPDEKGDLVVTILALRSWSFCFWVVGG